MANFEHEHSSHVAQMLGQVSDAMYQGRALEQQTVVEHLSPQTECRACTGVTKVVWTKERGHVCLDCRDATATKAEDDALVALAIEDAFASTDPEDEMIRRAWYRIQKRLAAGVR